MMDYDIVMVSIQYRVGPYGFLSTGDSAAAGNYGLHDQVLGTVHVLKLLILFTNRVPLPSSHLFHNFDIVCHCYEKKYS